MEHVSLEDFESVDPITYVAARMVPGAPLENIRSNLPIIIGALRSEGLTSGRIILVAIALLGVETPRFEPVTKSHFSFQYESWVVSHLICTIVAVILATPSQEMERGLKVAGLCK